MSSRAFLLTSSFFLFIVAHASPSLALQFTQDSFVFNAGSTHSNTTVELSDIDLPGGSFAFTAQIEPRRAQPLGRGRRVRIELPARG